MATKQDILLSTRSALARRTALKNIVRLIPAVVIIAAMLEYIVVQYLWTAGVGQQRFQLSDGDSDDQYRNARLRDQLQRRQGVVVHPQHDHRRAHAYRTGRCGRE